MDTLEIMYWRENKSLKDISNELGVSPQTVWDRMVKKKIPRRGFSEANRGKGTIKPDLSLTHNLSYVISTLLCDGCVTSCQHPSSSKYIKLAAVDEEFVNAFKSGLKAVGLHPWKYKIKSSNPRHNDVFCTCATSLKFYSWYKSLSNKGIEKIAFTYPYDFLRGAYDSEGTFYCSWEQRKERPNPYLRCEIRIRNTNEWLLDLSKNIATYIGFNFRKHTQFRKEKRKDLYEIYLSKRNEALRFLEEIKPNIPRKSINKYYAVVARRKGSNKLLTQTTIGS